MIELRKMENRKFRTFGWVQDPSDFKSLYNVVAIFDNTSEVHKQLVDERIEKLIEEKDGRSHFLEVMRSKPLKIKYTDLIGTAFTPRSSARCNGIVQATVEGQKRKFISDWPADNFVRWAHCLGFIQYNYEDDTFEITKKGLEWIKTKDASEGKLLLEEAILSYPPAIRILRLLSNGKVMTKFELGSNLGFIGEDGFTSIPQNVLIMTLATTESINEKNKIKTNTEGSSDKYARMIGKWLTELGLLKQVTKEIVVAIGGKEYKEEIGQSYIITNEGLKALNRAEGKSRFCRISKNVSWEMMATKGNDRNYIRTRRSIILKILAESKKGLTIDEIKNKLESYEIFELPSAISDDICGLTNIGLNIDYKSGKYYLSMVDLAYDSKQNRLFEMKTIELLINECNYKGLHLGGTRKPDGIVYTNNEVENYGIIIDTKAYSKGYNLPISQVDEMTRYVEENNKREKKRNPNEWWNNFDSNVKKFYFSFVSGKFVGNIEEKLQRITLFTEIYGNAITVTTLLYIANEIKANRMKKSDIMEYFNDKVY